MDTGHTPTLPRGQLLLLACTALAYTTACLGPFQFDDFGVIVDYAPVRTLATSWATLASGMRPLLKLSYALNWALDPGPLGFHVVNVLIHLTNVVLVMGLYRAAAPDAPARRAGALVAGALFALHPVQTEAVTYISGRSVSLMTLFVLLALRLYAEGARTRTAWRWLGLAPLAFAAGLLSKEAAATLPIALLAWELLVVRDRPRLWLPRVAAWAALSAGLFSVLLLNDATFRLLYAMTGQRPLADALALQVHGVAYLLSRLVWVHRLSIEPGLGASMPNPGVVGAELVLLGTLFAAALSQARTRPRIAFGVGWFMLQAFVPYVLLPRADVVNERHMYLANVGLFLAAGAVAEAMTAGWDARPLRRVGVMAMLTLAVLTTRRNLDYRSPTALWESTVRASPDSPRAYQNLGLVYERAGRLEDAREAFRQALRLEPRYAAARLNLGRVTRRLEPAGGAVPEPR